MVFMLDNQLNFFFYRIILSQNPEAAWQHVRALLSSEWWASHGLTIQWDSQGLNHSCTLELRRITLTNALQTVPITSRVTENLPLELPDLIRYVYHK